MSKSMSRRDFLKGAAAGAVSLSAMSILPATVLAQEGTVSETGWDAEYDVVILGFGGGGASAAIEACDAGAKVLLCEKAPEGHEGGNTKYAGQNIMATDEPERLAVYFKKLMGIFTNWEEELVDVYAQECYNTFNWLVDDLGADIDILYPTTVERPIEEEGTRGWVRRDNCWGHEREGYIYRWWEFSEIPEGNCCGSYLVSGRTFDASFYNLLHENVLKRDIDVWFASPGKELLKDETGRVAGVAIEQDGVIKRIKAKGGVIVATGSMENNKDMQGSFLQQPYIYVRAGVYNEGDGIKMCAMLGAQLWHMSNSAGYNWAWMSPDPNVTMCQTISASNGILVGPNGNRFMNEAASNRHGRIDIGGRWISMPTPLPTWYITDSTDGVKKMINTFSDENVEEVEKGYVLKADTLEELAEKIIAETPNASADFTENLLASAAKFNAAFHDGIDADYGRPHSSIRSPVEQGPFYSIKIGPTMYNSQGGPKKNAKAQVLDWNDEPIPGLYAAGEAGSLFCDNYNGGGNLGECAAWGRIAGRNATAEALNS